MRAPTKSEKSLRYVWHQSCNTHFLVFNMVFAVAAFGSLRDLIVRSWNSQYFTYIPFIPIITAYLLYSERNRIFDQNRPVTQLRLLIAIISVAMLVVFNARLALPDDPSLTSVHVVMMLFSWMGGYYGCYGFGAFRNALFPLLFLFFAVPIPQGVLESIISVLQKGSAEVAYAFIKLGGVPVARDGFVFHLSSMNIEVAPECSGIRSALSLIVTGALAGYFFLKKGWSRSLLIVLLLPITILKNGFRIASLMILGTYVDERILDSDLHRKGGFVFFILALIATEVLIIVLKKLEKSDRSVVKDQV